MAKPYAWGRILWGVIWVAVAILVAVCVPATKRSIDIIVTVFSILAGFLIAICMMVGDPTRLPGTDWKDAELHRDTLLGPLFRFRSLFYLYLVILLAAVVHALFDGRTGMILGHDPTWWTGWIEPVFLGLAVLAFGLSFSFPGALYTLQREGIDREIAQRRKTQGLSP